MFFTKKNSALIICTVTYHSYTWIEALANSHIRRRRIAFLHRQDYRRVAVDEDRYMWSRSAASSATALTLDGWAFQATRRELPLKAALLSSSSGGGVRRGVFSKKLPPRLLNMWLLRLRRNTPRKCKKKNVGEGHVDEEVYSFSC